MTTFCGIRTKRYALEGAACVALLLACAFLHGQDLPTTGLPGASQAGQQPAVPSSSPDAAQPIPNALGEGQADEDDDLVPKQAPLTPNVDHEIVSTDDVYTVHLRPLFTTVVRLPEPVTSLAVGAPTLIAAEHDKGEPRLVFIKPTTHKKVDSNVIVALQSGRTLAIRVTSAGDEGSSDPVDFVVDYSQPRSLMLGSDQMDTSTYSARHSATLPQIPSQPASDYAIPGLSPLDRQ